MLLIATKDGFALQLSQPILSFILQAGSLRAEFEREAAARQAAEEAAEKLTLERQRLQRARDELAASLLVLCQSQTSMQGLADVFISARASAEVISACTSAQAAQQRVAEAEEDQQRAEQQAAAQHEELQWLRMQQDSRRHGDDSLADGKSQFRRDNL